MRLSASQIKRYRGCPRSWAWSRDRGRPAAAGTRYALGSAVHAALRDVAAARWAARDPAPLYEDELLAALAAVAAGGEEPLDPATHAAAAWLLAGVAPVALGPQLLAPETAWRLRLGDGAPDVVGIWDAVTGGPWSVDVVDWKTGGDVPDDPEADPQVGIYLAAAAALWPDAEHRVVLRYLALGRSVRIRGTPELVAHHLAAVRGTADAIKDGRNHPTPGEACAWCNYHGSCDAAAAFLAPPPGLPTETDDLLAFRQRLRDLGRLAEAARGEADAELRRRVIAGPLEGGGWRATLRTRTRRVVAPAAASRLAEALGTTPENVVERAGRLSVTKLDKLVGDDARARAVLADVTDERTSTYLDVRKVKP